MKTIVRIEYIDGNGIWFAENKKGNDIVDYLSNIKEFSIRHNYFNTPKEDNINFIKGVHFCAFKSIEQLQQWVYPEEIREFLSLGFKVYLIDVSHYLEGSHQICYKKEDILQQKDISSLFI